MELRLLEYFIKVCEELHFTRAAEALGISQPTLSNQIRLLEGRVDAQLFERIGKKVFITQAGEVLLDHARRIFHELDQARAEIRDLKGLLRGKLSIGCSGNHMLTASAMTFHEQYPGIELSIMDMRAEDTIDGLLHNQLDIGVIFLSKQHEQLEYIHLFDEEFYLVVSENHPLADRTSMQFAELAALPLALLPSKFLIRQFIDAYCEDTGIRLAPKLQLSNLDSLSNLLRVNTVATILTKSYLSNLDAPHLRKIQIVDPVPSQPVALVYRKNVYHDTTMKSFVRHLVEHFAAWG